MAVGGQDCLADLWIGRDDEFGEPSNHRKRQGYRVALEFAAHQRELQKRSDCRDVQGFEPQTVDTEIEVVVADRLDLCWRRSLSEQFCCPARRARRIVEVRARGQQPVVKFGPRENARDPILLERPRLG